MIALASILVTVYAGYIGSPWWGATVCSTTLLVTLSSTHLRLLRARDATASLALVLFDLGPYCFAVGFGAYGIGLTARLIAGT